MRDVEILMRAFAMLINGRQYAPSMTRFLNQFAKTCQRMIPAQNEFLENLFQSFLGAAEGLPDDVFLNKRNRRFNLALFEAVFTAVCKTAFADQRMLEGTLDGGEIAELDADEKFLQASQQATTQKSNVDERLGQAVTLISAL